MTEHDPVTCEPCGTVNPWINENCRSCGVPLPHKKTDGTEKSQPPKDGEKEEAEPAAPQAGGPVKPAIRSIFPISPRLGQRNILWILLGVVIQVVIMWVGEWAIIMLAVSPDPELTAALELVTDPEKSAELSEQARSEIQSAFLGNGQFVFAVLAMLLIAPVLSGVIVGYFCGGMLEAAAAAAVAIVVLVGIIGGAIIPGLFIGPVFAGLGALGGKLGIIFRQRVASL